jgi:hypothetical protein
MTRDEAVRQFESEGFRACKRDWSMGATIGVGILNTTDTISEIERFSKFIYIFPIKDEWGVYAPDILTEIDYSRRYSLDHACEVARRFLLCEHLPFSPKSILIHQIRGEGGGYQVLEHVPTGAKKQLTRPTATGSEVLRKRHEALDELAFDLALGTSKAEQAGAGQPATRSESKSEGSDKPQPESEVRSR